MTAYPLGVWLVLANCVLLVISIVLAIRVRIITTQLRKAVNEMALEQAKRLDTLERLAGIR